MQKYLIKNKKKENTSNKQQDIPELINFDYTNTFGPSRGITRLQRWERAKRFGLNPPLEIKTKIDKYDLNKSVLDKLI